MVEFRKKAAVGAATPKTSTSDVGLDRILAADKTPTVTVNNGDEKSSKKSSSTGIDKITSELDANKELKHLKKLYQWDPNLSTDLVDGMQRAAVTRDNSVVIDFIDLIENDSPYPEVCAAVRNYDEKMPCNTIRAWTIGMFMATLGSGINMILAMRSPSIFITSFVAQLIAYPIGVGWTWIMPNREFKTFGIRWNLSPGPFNMKEHTLITVMANVSFGGGVAYATDTIVAQRGFYKLDLSIGFQLLLCLATQLIGYGYAGLLRKFLVWPASMMWPTTFVNTSLFYALHDHTATDPEKANGWNIGRYRWFLYIFCGSFVWYWVPGWVFQGLSYFAFATWAAPNNVIINQLFGYQTGLGLIPITFDWTQITGFTLSPLMYPWHAIGNTLIGVFIFFMVTTIGLHYSGSHYAAFLPISDSNTWDNTGNIYNVSRILTPDFMLDLAAYEAYSPLFLSTTFSLAYGLSFAAIMALLTHTYLYYRREIWTRAKMSMGEEPDVHTKMMRRYAEVPQWWYGLLTLSVLGLALVSCLAYETYISWWALFVALGLSAVFAIPIGMINAITNVQIGLNVIAELIIGYMQPGKPVAMMVFKTYGYITMYQALMFAQDLKLGHYMKVPPRVIFTGQVVATIWSCFVQVGVLDWAFANIKDICARDNMQHFTCPNGRVFFNASVVWGLIGPQRIFSPGQIYSGMLYFFVAGAIGPLIFYVLARMFPKSKLCYINVPLIFGGPGQIPPASTINYTTWAAVGFVFNKYIKNKYRGWWSSYNYVTSAGLDTGLAICTIVIFLTLQLTNQNFPNWWGNNVVFSTMDAQDTAIQQTVAPGQHFGPKTW